MPVRRNPAYGGDPYLAQATQNIAGLFATDPKDIATGALAFQKAQSEKLEAERVADLYAMGKSPAPDMAAFDRAGAAAGKWTPSQGYYAVDTKAATDKYGYDTTARTSLATNAADNARALRQTGMTVQGNTISSLYGTLNQGQVRPAVPEEVAGAVGLPAIGEARGAPKPLSETEIKAAILGSQPPELQGKFLLAGPGTQNVVRDGQNVVESNAGSIGMPAVPDPQKAPKVMTWVHPDSRQRGTATLGPNGALVDTQTQQPVPAGSVTAELAGGQEQIGLGTGAKNNAESMLVDLSLAEDTSKQLRTLVTANPAAQGAVGAIRGTVQDIAATGGEVGKLLNINMAQIQKDIAAGRVDPEVAKSLTNFDPNIPAANMLETLLTAQVAKVLDPNGRVSNDRYKQVQAALGSGGWLSNSQRTLATLDALDKIISSRRGLLAPVSPAAAAIGQPRAGAPSAAPGGFRILAVE